MKFYLRIFLFAFMLAAGAASAQNYPVKTVNGVEYYVYTVQSGEGLYGISRKFGVSQSDINNANPQLKDGLKAGETIIIPKKNGVKTVTATPVQEYIYHKVEKKQTLFAISRMYNVTQEEIISNNPQVLSGLKIGDTLRIPKKTASSPAPKQDQEKREEVKPAPKPEIKTEIKIEPKENSANPPKIHIGNESYISHTVQPKETLYSISRIYNVSVEDIAKMNEGADAGIKAGSVLKIPLGANTKIPGTTSTENPATNTNVKTDNTYRIAYLLPFMLNDTKIDPTVYKFIEFYMGSLLAVRSFQNNGMNYEVYTYDTEKTEDKVFSVINKPELQKMDLIIGPAYTTQIPILTDFAKRRQIPVIVPFSANIEHIDSNPYVFQFNPDKDLQVNFLADVLKNRFVDANITMVKLENGNDESDDYFDYLTKRLERANIKLTKITATDLATNSIDKYLMTDKKNLFIFDSYRLPAVQPYLSKLYDVSSKNDVAVVGQYSWKSKSGKKPKMMYISPFMSDERRALNVTYPLQYELYYGKQKSENHPRFDMIGYDITKYMLSLFDKNGLNVNNRTTTLKSGSGVQSELMFKRTTPNGGFMNQQLYFIEDAAKRN